MAKSTSVHAALLAAPVMLYTYPDNNCHLPVFDAESTLLVCADAEHTIAQLAPHTLLAVRAAVFVDGTWSQAAALRNCCPSLTSLQRVRLCGECATGYWRPQGKRGAHCLATIEAIAHFCAELMTTRGSAQTECQQLITDLLYFFDFLCKRINSDKK
jgi:DTW domain-containing protein YfiP